MKSTRTRITANLMFAVMTLSLCLGNGAFLPAKAADAVIFTEQGGWFETAYAEWTAVAGATGYEAYVKEASAADSAYVKLDNELIRKYPTYWRVDALGLKAGSYVIKVVAKKASEELSAVTSAISVKAHDRSGFAWVNGTSSGAYNEDGTLKSNAVVLYITEQSKDTVSLDVVTSTKGTTQKATGLQNIINLYKKNLDKRPLCIRIIGQVSDFAVMENGDIVVSGSGSEAGKRLSCGITIEGVGEDAVCDGWGIRVKNSSNVEIRNLGFMNCNSGEGDDVSLQQDNDHVWVHNCDLFYGDAGSDADQAKGDGAMDCKKSTYVTFSFNHFFDTGKSNLLGLSEGTTEGLFITYHHNWYDHSDSRHPRVRFYSAHVYNNYYDGIAKYGAGSTLGSSVFMEANYFRNCQYPMMTSMQGSDVFAGGTVRDEKNNATFSKEAGGSIKAYNNVMVGKYTFIPYGASKYVLKGNEVTFNLTGTNSEKDFDAYVVSNRNDQVPASVVSYVGGNKYNNFDTSAAMYSYTADDPNAVAEIVTSFAGRMNGGDFEWSFTAADDSLYDVNNALKAALKAYKTTLLSVGGFAIASATPTPQPTGITGAVNPTGTVTAAATPTPVPSEPGKQIYVYGNGNSFFTAVGSYKTGKSYTIDGKNYDKPLKLDSKGSLSFTTSCRAEVVIYAAGEKVGTSFALDNTKFEFGEVNTIKKFTATVEAGTHVIKKDNNGETWLTLVEVDIPEVASNPVLTPTSVPASPSPTPVPTKAENATPAATATPSPAPVSATPKPTESAATPTPDAAVTATPTPDVTATPTPDVTATPAPDATATPAPDATATPVPEASATPAPTEAPEVTPETSPEATQAPAATDSPEPTDSAEITNTPEVTDTPDTLPEPKPEQSSVSWIVILASVLGAVVVIGTAAFVVIREKKSKDSI